MNKIVTRINWVNDTDPAINDTHLNQMDSELDALDDRVIAMEGTVETQAENAEAWANGTRGGEAIGSSDPAYHKDAKYQAEQAASSASNAATSETNAGSSATAASGSANAASGSANTASQKALDSEAWAKGTRGGAPVGPTDETYENSAKYWAERAAAGQIQSDWDQTDNTKKDFIKNKPDSVEDFSGGTFAGQVNANATAAANLGTAQMRDVTISTVDLTPGTSPLATGAIYLVYEA